MPRMRAAQNLSTISKTGLHNLYTTRNAINWLKHKAFLGYSAYTGVPITSFIKI